MASPPAGSAQRVSSPTSWFLDLPLSHPSWHHGRFWLASLQMLPGSFQSMGAEHTTHLLKVTHWPLAFGAEPKCPPFLAVEQPPHLSPCACSPSQAPGFSVVPNPPPPLSPSPASALRGLICGVRYHLAQCLLGMGLGWPLATPGARPPGRQLGFFQQSKPWITTRTGRPPSGKARPAPTCSARRCGTSGKRSPNR